MSVCFSRSPGAPRLARPRTPLLAAGPAPAPHDAYAMLLDAVAARLRPACAPMSAPAFATLVEAVVADAVGFTLRWVEG